MAKNNKNFRGNKGNGKFGKKGTNNRGKACDTNKSATKFTSDNKDKFGSRDKRVESRTTSDSEAADHAYNDFSWYNKYPELINEVARLPFPNVPGMRIDNAFINNVGKNYTFKSNDINIPGVMTLGFIPMVGKSSSPSDPVSSAARELYTKVRAKFSGALKADAPDLMIHTLAQEQIYAYIAYLRRLYRTINSYSPDNIGMAEVLYAGLGFKSGTVKALQARKPDFLNMINTFIRMMDGLILPEVFTVQDRHVWMLDKVFSDIGSTKGQLIQFKPIGFYEFGLKKTPDNVDAGGLIFKELAINNVEPEDVFYTLYQYGESLINAFKSWEDCYLINGYFLEAFGSTAWGQAFVQADEIVEIYYEPYVLEQISNCTVPPRESADGATIAYDLDISQNPNTNSLIASPTITITGLTNADSISLANTLNVLTMDTPSPEEIVEATRLKAMYKITKLNGTSVKYEINGATECVVSIHVSYRLYNENTGQYEYTYEPVPSAIIMDLSDTGNAESIFRNVLRLATVSQWDFFPMIPLLISEDGTLGFYSVFGDIRNMTNLSDTELNNINRICLYSMFNSFGK